MNIDSTLQDQWTYENQLWQTTMPTEWMQGRSLFGGLSAAFGVALAKRKIDNARNLRTMNMHLIRPISPGKTTAACDVLREGRTATFVDVSLFQNGDICAKSNLVFSAKREDSLHIPNKRVWNGVDVESLDDLPYIEGVTPQFTKHISYRWVRGGWPFSGAKEASYAGYFRFKNQLSDAEGLVALLDAWPAPSLSMVNKPTFASTVSWSAHIFEIPKSLDQWFGFEYETIVGKDGMHTIEGHLYDADGQLIAWSEQLAAIYD